MTELQKHKPLFEEICKIIEQGKHKVVAQVNSTLTLTYWHIGKSINHDILQNQRAEYGKQIVTSLATELVQIYGRSFEARNLRRMMQFAELFPDFQIVSPLATQLSWTHFITLLSVKKDDARLFYAQQSIENLWSKRELQYQIERKVFERAEIATIKNDLSDTDFDFSFKDPYFLDFLGLKDGYLEKDIEGAILKELELFILELGKGFAFIGRQKRMIIDGEDFYLDLLFFNRILKRLVAVELKIGKFKAAHKGQMELYLSWLNQYERQPDEEMPIGLILCAGAGKEQVELLNMKKDGIMVAEYWTELPPKHLLEQKLHSALMEARKRIAGNKMLF
ncbi:MAG: PDDEXK nuclease domain-containing protein [Candidatus Kapabacteria bacterium]|nr:PDDEXK nuclease domain-containing protein [Candidatus Kapabacteria bacterium]